MKAFTVFMPVYNTEAYLNEAIESVLKQDYKDFDFLIIDDGSTDKSKEIIMSYSDPRIKFISAPHDYIYFEPRIRGLFRRIYCAFRFR